MLKNLFAKYARAVSDEARRAELYKKFIKRFIWMAAFCVLFIAIVVEALMFDPITDPTLFNIAVAIFLITMLLWLISAVGWIICAIKFRLAYRAILSSPPSADEMPEVVTYREKVRDASRLSGPVIAGIVLLIAGAVFMFAAIIYDVATNPESEELGLLTNISVCVFAVCLLVCLLTVIFSVYKKTAEGKTAEQQTESESAAIDAAQGREHKYSLRADKNAQSYRYLFPDENLQKEAENTRAKMNKVALIAVSVSAVAALIVCGVLFLPFICGFEWFGYSIPIIFAAITAAAIIASLPYARRLSKLEKLQKVQLEQDPALELNLRVYRIYEQYFKGKGRAIYLFYAASIVLSFVFAALFPDKIVSGAAVILIYIGIIINYVFMSQMRKKCLPIEREIDARSGEGAGCDCLQNEGTSLVNQSENIAEDNSAECKDDGAQDDKAEK